MSGDGCIAYAGGHYFRTLATLEEGAYEIDYSLKVWNAGNGVQKCIPLSSARRIRDLQSYQETILFVLGDDAKVYWCEADNADSCFAFSRFPSFSCPKNNFSPSNLKITGRNLALWDQKQVKLYDAQNGHQVWESEPNSSIVGICGDEKEMFLATPIYAGGEIGYVEISVWDQRMRKRYFGWRIRDLGFEDMLWHQGSLFVAGLEQSRLWVSSWNHLVGRKLETLEEEGVYRLGVANGMLMSATSESLSLWR